MKASKIVLLEYNSSGRNVRSAQEESLAFGIAVRMLRNGGVEK